MSKSDDARGATVGAVVNAVAILRHLAAQTAPLGVNAVARGAKVSPSSCFNILRTLVAQDLIEFDPVAKTYVSGAGLTSLLPQTASTQTAFTRCAPLLETLAERYGGTTALWRLAPSERLVLLGFAESSSTTRIHMTVGQRLPMLLGAGGRCVAAALGLSPQDIASRFEALRWERPPSLDLYRRQVAETAARGWALDDGNFLHGVTTLAVAIRDSMGRPAYVLGATFFRGQHPTARLERVGEDLAAAAPQLAKTLSL